MLLESEEQPTLDRNVTADLMCASCGARLPPGASEGLCARCLIGSVLAPPPPPIGEEHFLSTSALLKQRLFGGYELVEEIARGGMGVVFKARQRRPDRWVAIKVISAGELASPKLIERFRAETEAAASLEHSNIVSIYEVGEADGFHFFSMRLVEGQTLGASLGGHPLEPRRAAELLVSVARAAHYAHQRGVLHRDLKPNNILLDAQGKPHLTDFGLAKLLERDTDLTLSGAVLGTPSYMAPEQAAGNTKQLTIAADVYGLGAVFFEMLTGRPPFMGETSLATVRQVLDQDPPPPLSLNPAVPADLATICLKCLEKDPTRRYGSAAALADDLERWLRHEPIEARPSTPFEHGIKWVRRNPARAALLVTLAVSLSVISVVSSVMNFRAQQAKTQMQQAKGQTEQANRQLSTHLRDLEWQRAEDLASSGRRADALALFARFLRDSPDDSILATRILSVLSEHSFALPVGQPLRHAGRIITVHFNSTGDRVITCGDDGLTKLWNARTMDLLLVLTNNNLGGAFFSPDDRRILVRGRDGWTRSYNTNGTLLCRVPGGGVLLTGKLPPTEKRIWTIQEEWVRVWDGESGAALSPPLVHAESIRNVQMSADGSLLAVGCVDGSIQLWRTSDYQPAQPALQTEGWIRTLLFSPDGTRLMAGTSAGVVAFWDPRTGELIRQTRAESNEISDAVYSGDSQLLGTVTFQNRVRVWNGHTGEMLSEPFGDTPMITDARFSPNDKRIVLATREGTARLWDAMTQQPLMEPFEHEGPIERMDFSPDGTMVVTASQDGTARLWDVRMASPSRKTLPLAGKCFGLVFSPDGSRFALAGGRFARLHDTRTGQPLGRIMEHQNVIYSFAFSADDRMLSTSSEDMTVRLWDAHTGEPLAPPFQHPEVTWSANFSPDGQLLATTCRDTFLRLLDVKTGKQLGLAVHASEVISAEFSADGEKILTASLDGAARVFAVRDLRQLLFPPLRHKGIVWSALFNRTCTRIVTASADRTAQLWDAQTGRPIGTPMRHNKGVRSAVFTPNDQWVLTASDDGTARVWDAASGQPVSRPMRHQNGAVVLQASFDPQANLVLTASEDGLARLWDARTGFAVSEPMPHRDRINRARFTPDGRRVITASHDGTACFWDVLTAPAPVAPWLPELAEALAGRRFSPQRELQPVPPEVLQALKARLAAGTETDFYARWARWFFVERLNESVTNWQTALVN